MAKTSPYRIQYGASTPPADGRTGLGRWMLAVTGLLVIALAVHFVRYVLVTRDAGTDLLPRYGRIWAGYLGIPGPAWEPPPTPETSTVNTQLPTPDPPAVGEPATDPNGLGLAPGMHSPEAGTSLLEYLPLNDHCIWEYATRVEQLNATPAPPKTVRFRVVAVDRTAERPVYRVTLESMELFYFLSGPELRVTRSMAEPGMVVLRAPLERGTSWESPPGVVRYSVMGESTINTAFGRLACLRIVKEPVAGTGERGELFYAPGIGLVRQEVQLRLGEQSIWELIGYTVNGRSAGTLETAAEPAS